MKPNAAEPERQRRFADLYRRDHPDVLRFVRRRSAPDAAEDVVHEVFLIAWRRFDVVPTDPDAARAWLFTTARNCLLSDTRAHNKRRGLLVEIGDASAEPATDVVDPDFEINLVRAWQQLDPAQQEALALAIWEDLPSNLAGQVLGVSAAAYRLRLHRARTRLRHLLQDNPADAADPGAHTLNRKHA